MKNSWKGFYRGWALILAALFPILAREIHPLILAILAILIVSLATYGWND